MITIIPEDAEPGRYRIETRDPGVVLRIEIERGRRPLRHVRGGPLCMAVMCLPGLGGNCVGCGGDD